MNEYPHKLEVKEIPVPTGMIQVTISTDYGTHIGKDDFYAERDEFLNFWKPLVDYYEGVKSGKEGT